MLTYRYPVPVVIALLAGFIALGCREPAPQSFHLDRSTRPGERLWVLEVTASGRDSLELDRWVVGPMLRALSKDARLDLTAVVSYCERSLFYLRARVHLSSLDILTEIIGNLALPDAIDRPNLSPAGSGGWPGGQAGNTLVIRVMAGNIDQLEDRMNDVVSRLADPASVAWVPSRHGFIRAELVDGTVVRNPSVDSTRLAHLARYSSAYVLEPIIRLRAGSYAGYILTGDQDIDLDAPDLTVRSIRALKDAERAVLGGVDWNPDSL